MNEFANENGTTDNSNNTNNILLKKHNSNSINSLLPDLLAGNSTMRGPEDRELLDLSENDLERDLDDLDEDGLYDDEDEFFDEETGSFKPLLPPSGRRNQQSSSSGIGGSSSASSSANGNGNTSLFSPYSSGGSGGLHRDNLLLNSPANTASGPPHPSLSGSIPDQFSGFPSVHKYTDSPPPHAHQPRLTLSNRKCQGQGLGDHDLSEGKESSEDSPRRGQPPVAPRGSRYPRELKKLLVACVFMFTNFVLTCISLAFVHEDRPMTEPLPDQILDRFPYQKWALYGSEVLITIQVIATFTVVFFHKHRFIVLRRTMLIIGVLYLYRAITMWVTVLPSADPTYECAPKFGKPLTVKELFKRVFTIMTGFGLSINGNHIYCGDFIYSGHTMTITLGHLVISEYTPSNFGLLHWTTFFNAVTAVALLMLSRGHYTVDVILAYFFVTRLWAMYHSIAGHPALKQVSDANVFSTFWWFGPFSWFEANVKAGRLPNEYNVPLPILRRIINKIPLGLGDVLRERRRRRRRQVRKYGPAATVMARMVGVASAAAATASDGVGIP